MCKDVSTLPNGTSATQEKGKCNDLINTKSLDMYDRIDELSESE